MILCSDILFFGSFDLPLIIAKYTGLPIVEVRLSTTCYDYDTSVEKAVETLGYKPQYDIFKMIDDVDSQLEVDLNRE